MNKAIDNRPVFSLSVTEDNLRIANIVKSIFAIANGKGRGVNFGFFHFCNFLESLTSFAFTFNPAFTSSEYMNTLFPDS